MNLEDFADKFCQDHFGELSLYRYILHSTSAANTEAGIKMLMNEYARECCKASLEKATGDVTLNGPIESESSQEIWDIITNLKNIVLL